jgi:two-component system CheB/CheR fusion protein
VIQHLSPDYKSLMVELLSKKTSMPVHRAEDNMAVLPNHVYLIPPKKNLSIFHGKLILSEQDHSKGVNLPIDVFFKSLAEDQAEKSIGIILSGTGSDGTRGLRVIKEYGGMVIVQKEDSARFDGMPRAAISTGLSDFILAPEQMPGQLLSFAKHPYAAKAVRSETIVSDEDGLTRIFSILRERCKVDFTYYKPNTIIRRIERRMAINQTDSLNDYVDFIIRNPGEVTVLYRELLIGVTSFFRDQEAFNTLTDKWMQNVFGLAPNRELRFWVAGCSTGEEAYSLAILAREYMERTKQDFNVKIFATDIDREAIHYAAAGSYPESIRADIPSELLTKYFLKKDDTIQIARTIREMVVFAQHNIIKDPPFTNISLLSCRNLMIYLQPNLQKKVFEFFNFSLVAGGFLFLGLSESTGEMSDYFEPLDVKHKIYRSRGLSRPVADASHLLSATDTRSRDMRSHYSGLRRFFKASEEERILERFFETVSTDYLPLSLIVNENLEILHTLGDPAQYIKVPIGKLINDISKMTIKELTIPITTGLQKVFRLHQEVRFSNIRIKQNTTEVLVNIRIIPFAKKKGQDDLATVIIGETRKIDLVDQTLSIQSYDMSKEAEDHLHSLEQELQFTRENLQATIEELETSNEELQATNEELLASNEELQSTNEELQSTNEELFTVNAEYQSKIIELTELTNDIDNILSISQISFLLIDENFEVRRFSPNITKLFSLLNNDIGRPITHIPNFISNSDPVALFRVVLSDLKPVELEIADENGRFYMMRVEPYSIGPKSYSGLVASFFDITELKKSRSALMTSEERFKNLFDTMELGVVYQNDRGEITSVNPAAENILGLTLEQMQGKKSIDPHWHSVHEDGSPFPGEEHPSMIALKTGNKISGVIMGVYNPKKQNTTWIHVSAVPMFKPGAKTPFQVYATFQDITIQREAQSDAMITEKHFRQLFDEMQNGIAVHEMLFNKANEPVNYRFISVNPAFEEHTGLKSKEILGKTILEIFPQLDPGWIQRYGEVVTTGIPAHFVEYSKELNKTFRISAFRPGKNQFAVIVQDITDQKILEDQLRELQKIHKKATGKSGHDKPQ